MYRKCKSMIWGPLASFLAWALDIGGTGQMITALGRMCRDLINITHKRESIPGMF